uniref:RNA helicase n=1 Tax=Panagrellus redivivus TaxID=6233 RepID=A0A7E4VV65_PANRE
MTTKALKQQPSKKRKAGEPVILDLGGKGDDYSVAATPNDLILAPKKKKVKKQTDAGANPQKRENKKRVDRREELAAVAKQKLSKTKQKLLAKTQEKIASKQTMESLFEGLKEFQFDSVGMSGLVSTAHMQDKQKKPELAVEADPVFPKKIRSVSSAVVNGEKKKVQANYFETDSESDGTDSGDEVEIVEPKKEEAPEESEPVPKPVIDPKKAIEAEAKSKREERLEKFYKILSTILGPKIAVQRIADIQLKRSKLPIFAEEVPIVEAINENAVVIVSSETGSGKTTQIPQFLYEAGYTSNGHLIGVTEPRRVAAMSMAERVGIELNDPAKVSYQIRFEGNRTDDTKILFMTDGVLLKELRNDSMLWKYSVIIIDEAHERSMYSDVLIGLLSRICFLRAKKSVPLKLIIMSATLRLTDFTQKKLFPVLTPKIVKVESRQFEVQVHFERKTPDDFVEAVYKKVCNIHEKLPDGAILVFVSGQNEVKKLIHHLSGRYPLKGKNKGGHLQKKKAKAIEAKETVKLANFADQAQALLDGKTDVKPEIPTEKVRPDIDEHGAADCDLLEDDEDEETLFGGNLAPPPPGMSPLFCLPLYSLLPSIKQQRVFAPPPEGTRLCVIATNVAETSLTIPNVKYVVDSGKEKRRDYDPITGVSQFNVHWISQASAEQRSGRAGRVQAGHAYRLYSSALFEDFDKFSAPEILNKPVDQLVLDLKAMNILKIANFPFPTPPNVDQLAVAEKRLTLLGALTLPPKQTEAKITPLGKTLSLFPLSPPFAKVLAMANQHDLMPYAIYLVSALSVREPMSHVAREGLGNDSIAAQKRMKAILKQRHTWCGIGQSRRLGDLSVLLKALGAADFGRMTPQECENLGLRFKAVVEIRKMRRQLVNLINTSCNLKHEITIEAELPPPTEEQCRQLRQILIACLPNQIAKRVNESPDGSPVPDGAYQCQLLEEYVFIDSTSMLHKDRPDFILYQEIVQFGPKKCFQNVTMVEPEWLPKLAEPYCEFVFPDPEKEEPRFDSESGAVVQSCTIRFGERRWMLEKMDRPMPMNILHYKHFARFFLGGFVCPKLFDNVSKMLAPPDTMIKPWAKLQKRTEKLLNALVAEDVHTRDKLLEVWSKNEEYLLDVYLEWLPVSTHDKIRLSWPPLDA